MSIDVYLTAVHEGNMGHFPLSVIDAVFKNVTIHKEISDDKCHIYVEYPNKDAGELFEFNGRICKIPDAFDAEVSIDIIHIDNIPMASGLSVNRPPGVDAFWDSLYEILKTTHSVLYSSDIALIIGQQETIVHIIPEMIEALGEPFLIENHKQIFQVSRES
ncbi:hypothetical protein M942_05415 [Enterobacter ludwigii]|uniref:hypothetical protein n=1 Tax=Enterobacter ludwigii TaxID=299767 RepID=UPI0003D8A808|nr:hypothetical protein [Enterobacter ludwigii]AHE72657.1 hypothetical protein M942_05415 [Enterobacter ludwigii]